MNARIYKYELPVGHPYVIVMPIGSHVIHAACQHRSDTVTLWAEAPQHSAPEARRFVALPTGAEVPVRGHHVRTVLTAGGDLVWHVYETSERLAALGRTE
jgi:hypothetical protein